MQSSANTSSSGTTSTKSSLIRPPPDLRAIVDKTAAFIGKMGDEFEVRIQSQSGGDTTKFRFLSSSDPYHAYYKHKVMEARTGGSGNSSASTSNTIPSSNVLTSSTTTTTTSSKPISPDSDQTNKEVLVNDEESTKNQKVKEQREELTSSLSSSSSSSSSSMISMSISTVLPNPLARALKSFDASLYVPPHPIYSVLTPIGISASAADRIRLTAEFTATSGRRFLASLTSREFNNPEFDFLRPSNPYFSYYTTLVDAYAKVLSPPPNIIAKVEALSNDMTSSYSFLESVVHEAEWMRLEEEKKRKEEDAGAASAGLIDWHNFFVVETVELKDFVFENETNSLSFSVGGALPLSVNNRDNEEEEEEMDVEEEQEEDMDMDIGSNSNVGKGEEEFLNIRMDYTEGKTLSQQDTHPSSLLSSSSTSSGGGGGEVYLDPISGLSVPIDRANDHIKAQMLDPLTKVYRQRFEAKQSKTLFTTGEDLANNLKKLVGGGVGGNGSSTNLHGLSSTTTSTIGIEKGVEEIGVELPPSGPAFKRPRTDQHPK
jgi:splicing factor 3A subunit 1